ncbi:hypothetical protein BST81_02175 [Leptolyngbya sp. 'hensonii']|nr:hypothetical protein BST81_02175 [Leptolyngbya sp. 'hensonii']
MGNNRHFWTSSKAPFTSWGNAPDVSGFQGREAPLEQLVEKICIEGCRLNIIFGLGGIGKTFLSVKLAQQVRDQFDFVIWRSLKHFRSGAYPPPVSVLAGDLIQFISHFQDDSSDWSRLIDYLIDQRCLIILDGVEVLLQAGVHDGSYQDGYAEYKNFFQHIGNTAHNSCFILTSREKIRDVETTDYSHVYAWRLKGFGRLEGRQFLEARGCLATSDSNWQSLISRYSGNPLALGHIATNILELFDGNITSFLNHSEMLIPHYILRNLFDEQFERLSDLERSILKYLTEQHEPTKFNILQDVLQSISNGHLQEALLSLRRRSLIELSSPDYSLQMLIREYLSHRFNNTLI